MRKLFVGLMLLFTVSSGVAIAGWWDNDKDKDKEETVVEEAVEEAPEVPPVRMVNLPFDVAHLAPYVQEDNYYDSDCVVKRTNYIMEMKPTQGPWGTSMKVRDRFLNLKIKINMMGQVWDKPVECHITQGPDLYVSRSICVCRVSSSKVVYIISFRDTNSFLVIYKPKKSNWKAQWAFLESK